MLTEKPSLPIIPAFAGLKIKKYIRQRIFSQTCYNKVVCIGIYVIHAF